MAGAGPLAATLWLEATLLTQPSPRYILVAPLRENLRAKVGWKTLEKRIDGVDGDNDSGGLPNDSSCISPVFFFIC